LIIIFAKLLENLSSKMGKRLFTTSFDEASQKIFLEIDSKTELNFLYDNDNLVQISKIDKNNYFYRLIFVNKKEIDELKKLLDSKDISYEIRYNF
jgi:disulfide oxidoreductase YuzD